MSRTLDRELEGVEKRLMVEVWPEELEPMIRCPRWQGCSAPICPLDPQKDQRTGPLGDELRCTLSKAKRMELGALLPWRGLWPGELGALRRWERRSPEGRRQFVAGGEKSRFSPVVGES